AELDLDRIDVRDASRVFDLADGDVAEADRFDPAVSLQARECTNAGRERSPRIRCMQLIKMKPVDTKRAATVFARTQQMLCATIRFPSSIRPRETAFGRDADKAAIAGPGGHGASNQPLVMTAFGVVPTVR